MSQILFCINKNESLNPQEIFTQTIHQTKQKLVDYKDFKSYKNLLLCFTQSLDFQSQSKQKIYDDEKYTLIYDGKLYNAKELKEELYLQGYRFHTQNDEEIIINAYDFWKNDCVNHLDGAWSFALINKSANKLFCSRDRIGEKTLYYYQNEKHFLIASEIKALLPFVKERKANIPAIIPFITSWVADFYKNETFFQDIYRLNPSTNLTLDLSNFSYDISQYYFSRQQEVDVSNPEKKVRELLEESVLKRMDNTKKMGSFLSGGLDSSCANAILAKYLPNKKDFIAINSKSSQVDGDESEYAKMVAKHLGIELCIIEPTKKDFLDSIDKVILTQEESVLSASNFAQHFVIQKAKELGVEILFSGNGSDETFLSEQAVKYIYHFGDKKKDFFEFFNDLRSGISIKNLFEDYNNSVNFDSVFKKICDKSNIKDIYLHKGDFKDILDFTSLFDYNIKHLIREVLHNIIVGEARDSMYFEIGLRYPFMDKNLMEYVISLSIEIKFQKGYLKYLLRKACEDLLPKEIIWRYLKMGFPAPQKTWFEGFDKEMIATIHKSKILNEIFNKIDIREENFMWRLYNIAKWEELYKVTL